MNLDKIVGFLAKNSKAIAISAVTVGATIAAVISTDKAIAKVVEVREEYDENIEKIKSVREDKNIPDEKYTIEDAKNDTLIFKTQAVVKYVKATLLPASMLIAGAVSMRYGYYKTGVCVWGGVCAGANIYALKDKKNDKDYKSRLIRGEVLIGSMIAFVGWLVCRGGK